MPWGSAGPRCIRVRLASNIGSRKRFKDYLLRFSRLFVLYPDRPYFSKCRCSGPRFYLPGSGGEPRPMGIETLTTDGSLQFVVPILFPPSGSVAYCCCQRSQFSRKSLITSNIAQLVATAPRV